MAGTTCLTCAHPMREHIDRHLVLRTMELTPLMRKYDIDRAAIWRHRKNHISEDTRKRIIAAALEEAREKEAMAIDSAVTEWKVDTRQALFNLSQRVEKMLSKAEKDGDLRIGVAVAAELRRHLEAVAKVQGDLNASQVIVLGDNPAWLKARDHLYAWISTQPTDVRDSFVRHMRKLEGGASHEQARIAG